MAAAKRAPDKQPKKKGRPVGSPNKFTASAKAVLEDAFERLGGVDAFVVWGKTNPDEFYKLWGKIIPRPVEVAGAGGGPLLVRVVRDSAE